MEFLEPVRELCQQVAQRELPPVAVFLQAMLERMGAHFDDLAGRNAGDWLARHIDGLRSLTTGAADASWISNGSSFVAEGRRLPHVSIRHRR